MLITGRRVDACLPARRTETGEEIRGELRKEDARSSRLLASKRNRYDRKNWNKKRMNEDGGGGRKRNSRNADIYKESSPSPLAFLLDITLDRDEISPELRFHGG